MKSAMRDAVKKSRGNKRAARNSKAHWKESSRKKRALRSKVVLASLVPVLVIGILYCLHTFGYIRVWSPRPLSRALANPPRALTLNLTHYYLKEVPQGLETLDKLQSLVLESNQIKAWDPAALKLPQLRILNLNYNLLTEIPKGLASLSGLKKLSLDGNKITEIPTEISLLENLETLSLKSNGLTKIPNEIGELKKLKTLDLSSNQLTEIPDSISQMKSLETLMLSGNPLARLPSLAGLKNLKTVSLRNTRLSPGEIQQLKIKYNSKGVTINS